MSASVAASSRMRPMLVLIVPENSWTSWRLFFTELARVPQLQVRRSSRTLPDVGRIIDSILPSVVAAPELPMTAGVSTAAFSES
jgi:hypothetical protein